MSDASVTKAVPIEEQSPLVEALHRRLAAAEARIGDWEAVFDFDDYEGDRLLLPAVARGGMAAKDRRIAELEGLLRRVSERSKNADGLTEEIDAALARETT